MIPRTLPEQIADIYHRLAETERRGRNRRRTGVVDQVDHEKGRYRVRLSQQGEKPYLTGWITPRQLGAGLVKIDILLSEGEQVDVVSESGDLTDAQIDLSNYSEQNPRSNGSVPLSIHIGSAVFEMSGDGITMKAGSVKIDGDVEITGSVLSHNGINVGDSHAHTGVETGPSVTGPPEG
jgi:phage baseplate assembly protein gpV